MKDLISGKQNVTNLEDAYLVISYCKAEKDCQSALLNFNSAQAMFKILESLTKDGYTCEIMDNDPKEGFFTIEVSWGPQLSAEAETIFNNIDQLREEVREGFQEMKGLITKVKKGN